MDAGVVVERGTHDELLEIEIQKSVSGKTTAGLYHDLWATQMGDSVEHANQVAALEKEVRVCSLVETHRLPILPHHDSPTLNPIRAASYILLYIYLFSVGVWTEGGALSLFGERPLPASVTEASTQTLDLNLAVFATSLPLEDLPPPPIELLLGS